MNNREIGAKFEQKTKKYLESVGHTIIKMNYQCRYGEIDIISKDGNAIVFTEVKFRRTKSHGHPSEAVDYHKKIHIIQVAKWYVMENRLDGIPVRFDVAVWTNEDLTYYKGAFESYG